MNSPKLSRPETSEYAAFYANYVALVENPDIISALENQMSELQDLCTSISEEKSLYSYAEGKWTIKELLGHLIDGERIFAYRAYRISRNDQTPLSGFEQDDYIENGHFNDAKLTDLIEEFNLLRKANLIFFKSLKDNAWLHTGIASDVPVSVRALAYMIVGHVTHHTNILKSKYLI